MNQFFHLNSSNQLNNIVMRRMNQTKMNEVKYRFNNNNNNNNGRFNKKKKSVLFLSHLFYP